MWRAFTLLVSAFRPCNCTGPRITACAVHQPRPNPLRRGGASVASAAKVCIRQDSPGETPENPFSQLSRSVGSSCSDCKTRTGEHVLISNSIAFHLVNIRLPSAALHILARTHRRNARWLTHSASQSRHPGHLHLPPSHLCHHPARTAAPIKAEQAWSTQYATPQPFIWPPPAPH